MMMTLLSACDALDVHKTSGGEIDAIYWHEGRRYTAMTENAGLIEQHKIPPWGGYGGSVTLYKDVASDAKLWYKCEWDWNGLNGSSNEVCEIHIHSLDDLGTADWDHGKFGSGSTTRID